MQKSGDCFFFARSGPYRSHRVRDPLTNKLQLGLSFRDLVVHEIHLHLRYEGGSADDGRLPLYDAGMSLQGIARSVNAISHAFAQGGDVRGRQATAKGVETFINAPKKGCFEERIDIQFSSDVVKKIGPTVLVPNFWDFMVVCVAAATGIEYEPTMPFVKRALEADDAFVYEMAYGLESAMQEFHRPIRKQPDMKMFFARDRVGDVFEFNSDTSDYVYVRDESETPQYLLGNVTKYNLLSGFGRAFIVAEGRTVSFQILDFEHNPTATRAAAASMHERASGSGTGDRRFLVTRVTGAAGRLKRLLVHEVVKP